MKYGGLGQKIGKEIGMEFAQYVKGDWFSKVQSEEVTGRARRCDW